MMEIYKVDEEATKAAVEKYLKQAREYMVTEYIPEEPSVTASYSDAPRSFTGLTSDQTGRLAQRNVDEPERRKRHIERAEQAVNRLGRRQQRLIRLRYLEDDDMLDFDVAQELGFSDRHYRRIKSVAIYRLATTLGLLVLRDD
ncbi:ArpU family phage packaging/lysis transcriptional regulator [Paenibacillus sp. SYP-B4298]|uniref:ArpU family phage packaging/lysis transcriptional regulator n=1 Tax=Paenibacillus sp. SYP-B4298 TaxID=2996034 RepID=UPI0022DD6F18|nr:ArpU family phage packaging/lysis transcriptional regulator [Paenibacillus sp. SYP-B4298]